MCVCVCFCKRRLKNQRDSIGAWKNLHVLCVVRSKHLNNLKNSLWTRQGLQQVFMVLDVCEVFAMKKHKKNVCVFANTYGKIKGMT